MAVLDDIHMSQSLPAECKSFEADVNAPPIGKTIKQTSKSIDGVDAQSTRNQANTAVYSALFLALHLLFQIILTI
jgi:hypothetical protein